MQIDQPCKPCRLRKGVVSVTKYIYIYIYICNRNRVLGMESDCEMMGVDPCDDLKEALWEQVMVNMVAQTG